MAGISMTGNSAMGVQQTAPAEASRPLCVDLDGTLVKSDTLADSMAVLARQHPGLLVKVPMWLFRGRASLKAQLARAVALDVVHLPYNQELLSYLVAEHAQGRHIYLATGADQALARRIAEHLGIFAGVLASDGSTNRTGAAKLAAMRESLGAADFDYIGNASPDLPLLTIASRAFLANPSASVRAALKKRGIHVAREFCDRPPFRRAFAKTIRLHQWAKNVLMFVPVLLAHDLRPAKIACAIAAFFAMSLFASAAYIVNDLLDIESDRRHPIKRLRPFASGDMPVAAGVVTVCVFAALSLAIAQFLPGVFLGWLLGYLCSSLLYSFFLKQVVLVDVLVLAGLYTLRMLAGGAATDTPISPWLAGFSGFLFLSLAMVKRFSELRNSGARGETMVSGRGYLLADIEQMRTFGTSSAYASVVVFAIYISGHDVEDLYAHPYRLWLVAPLMVLWLSRVWLLASRGELDEDPVLFALTDRMSLLIGVAVVLTVLFAMVGW